MTKKRVVDSGGALSPSSSRALEDLSFSALFSLLDHQATYIRILTERVASLTEQSDRYLQAWTEAKELKAARTPGDEIREAMGDSWNDLPPDLQAMVGAKPTKDPAGPSALDTMAYNLGMSGGGDNS